MDSDLRRQFQLRFLTEQERNNLSWQETTQILLDLNYVIHSKQSETLHYRGQREQSSGGPVKKDKDKGRGQKPYDRSNRNRNQNQSGSQNSNQNRSKGKGGKGKGKGKGKSQNPQTCNRCGRVGHIEKDCYSTKTPDGKDIKGKPPAQSPFQNRRQQQQNQGAKDGSGKLINTINTLVKELKSQHSINAAVATPAPASAPAPQGNSQGTAQAPVFAQYYPELNRLQAQRGRHSAQAGMTLAHLITNPCDELDQLEQMEDDIPLPWERQERVEDGSLALVTELLAIQAKTTRTPRILVLFSGTGSVEREFLNCFPSASVVTLDSGHIWQPTHVCDILQWDYKQYPPGFFDVVWASPPCRQYSQARTTGGPPDDLPQADKIVRRALQIIDYLEPKHWFMENPKGRFPNALRLRPMMRQLPPPLVCTYCMYDGQPVLIQRLLSLDLTRSRLEQVDLRVYIPCQHFCYDNFSDIYASATLKTRFRFQVAPFFLKVVPW
ncbi:hypothetical protein CYMTET_39131 [Cymbomonas tetramitiformis]|uniref:CCHC-type domain-containing protein n=1 Tax=Cymbomonas tetramitiformis TaxID=36881 RepID=A0AAE0CAP3_9CHLO|nr:hypothetical protein CYMTET_39131 [Cymbomonas tetramitiformis]